MRGRFLSVAGRVDIGADPADSSVVATVATATVSVGCDEIDARLCSSTTSTSTATTAEFRSTDVVWGGRRARVSGLLTIVGVSDTIELDVHYTRHGHGPVGTAAVRVRRAHDDRP